MAGVNIARLASELTGDPVSLGYAALNDRDAAAKLNATDTARTRNFTSITSSKVFNAINKAEFNALSAGDQQRVWDILHMGELNPFGLEADLFVDIFGGGSTTIANLQGVRKETISRAKELGFPVVQEGDVQLARAL